MPILNFDFPGVALEQVFTQPITSPTAALGTCIIGHRDINRPADTVFGVYNGWRPAGDTSECEVQLTNVLNKANVDTTPANIKVSLVGKFCRGILPATTVPAAQWLYKTGTEAQYDITMGGTILPGGEEGVDVVDTIGTAGIVRGCSVRVMGTGEDAGKWFDAPVVAVSQGTLPGESGGTATCKFTIDMAGAEFTLGSSDSLVFHRILEGESYAKTFDFGAGFTITTTGEYPVVGIPPGLTAATTSLNSSDEAIEATIENAEVFVAYKEFATDKVGSIFVFSSVEDIKRELGAPGPDNPEAAAVFCAFAESKYSVTYYTRAMDETASAYTDAMVLVEDNSGIYNIVPATTNADIVNTCVGVAYAQSSDRDSKVRRVVWYGVPMTEHFINAPNYGARTSRAIAEKKAKTNFYNYRLRWVWCNGALFFNGSDVTDYPFIAAAASAGLRSGEDCWRPLSNLPLHTVDVGVAKIGAVGPLPKGYLKSLGAEGFWLLSRDRTGATMVMKQMTAAASNNINIDEDSIVANADEIALSVMDVGETLTGNTNINETTIKLIEDTIHTRLTMRTANARNAYVGNQIRAFKIDGVYQSTVNLDKVYASFSVSPPPPFNKLDMTLSII